MKVFYKEREKDKIYWVEDTEQIGLLEFSFDGKKIYNFFQYYPHNLTAEERRLFDKENPFWRDFNHKE